MENIREKAEETKTEELNNEELDKVAGGEGPAERFVNPEYLGNVNKYETGNMIGQKVRLNKGEPVTIVRSYEKDDGWFFGRRTKRTLDYIDAKGKKDSMCLDHVRIDRA